MKVQTAEQKARDMLERMGVKDAQSFSSGDLVELANLIAQKGEAVMIEQLELPKCDTCGNPATHTAWDVREIMPKDGYREYERIPKSKHGCADHPVESVTYDLNFERM